MPIVSGEVTFTDGDGVVHEGEETSIISTCGRFFVDLDSEENKVRGRVMDDPPKPVTCLFCLVGGDDDWRQLKQTLKLIEQFGVTVEHARLDALEAAL